MIRIQIKIDLNKLANIEEKLERYKGDWTHTFFDVLEDENVKFLDKLSKEDKEIVEKEVYRIYDFGFLDARDGAIKIIDNAINGDCECDTCKKRDR